MEASGSSKQTLCSSASLTQRKDLGSLDLGSICPSQSSTPGVCNLAYRVEISLRSNILTNKS